MDFYFQASFVFIHRLSERRQDLELVLMNEVHCGMSAKAQKMNTAKLTIRLGNGEFFILSAELDLQLGMFLTQVV